MDTDKQARILVVDDEEEIRKTLSRHFRFEGFQVYTAANGVEALEVLNTKRMEIVITDILMPHMDGIELIREVQAQYPMIHTIVITGSVRMHHLLAALRHGADTCIFKPIEDMQELDDAVNRAMDHLRTWQRKLRELQGMAP